MTVRIKMYDSAPGGGDVFVIGDPDIMNDYINSFEVMNLPGDQTIASSVAGHNRKRYPGDAGTSVDGHARTRKVVATLGGNTRPGFRFWLERPTGEGVNRRSNARQFNYIGDWGDLVAIARAGRTGSDFILRNSSGRSVTIVAPG